MNKHVRAKKIVIYAIYILTALFFLYPLFWVLSISFKTVPELFQFPPKVLPKTFQFDNYKHVFENTLILRYLRNTLILVGATVVGTLIISIPAAYGFSRYRFKKKDNMMFGVLIFQMMSPLIVAIPLYNYLAKLGLLNNIWIIILVYIALRVPFTTWYLKGYFDTIPKELDEAAKVDGCSRMKTIWSVIIPVTIPGIISAVILNAMSAWSQFIIPFILMDKGNMLPLSVGIVNLQSSAGGGITTHYLAAACVVSVVPMVILYVIFQRFIVSALTAGSVKG
jgi:multiple sugar transport system permease protein